MSSEEEVAGAVRDLDVLNGLYLEAMRQHGDDWHAVWRDVRSRIEALDPSVRSRLNAALTLMLRVQPPPTCMQQ